MRNATQADVDKAQRTGELEENVMYETLAGTLVHGKRQSNTVKQVVGRFNNKWVLCETAEGELRIMYIFEAKPIEVGPATTPKKPRRKPTKGTKPFKEVPFDKALLKEGVRVKFRCGKTGKICRSSKTGELVLDGLSITNWRDNGEYYYYSDKWDIVSIFLPYEEQKQTNVQATPSQSEIDKQNFENGLWVPFIATEDNSYPKWLRAKQIVEVMLGDGSKDVSLVDDFYWESEIPVDCKIVAFKKL